MSSVEAKYLQRGPYDAPAPDIRLCLELWDGLRGARFAPAWSEFDWIDIPAELIPHFGVVDVVPEPFDLIYRYWGMAHVDAHGQELTGKSVREMRPEAEGASVFQQYEETFRARKPLLFVNTIVAGKFEIKMQETSLRLPFSDDGETVTHLMAFSDIRSHQKQIKDAFGGEAP